MGISIGNQNVIQGNVNIGNGSIQIAKNFNQEFNSVDKLLELLKLDLQNYYQGEDKETIIREYELLQAEMAKPAEDRDPDNIKKKWSKLNGAFQFISNFSSIAGLILTLI